jgi:hypothetical protein
MNNKQFYKEKTYHLSHTLLEILNSEDNPSIQLSALGQALGVLIITRCNLPE